MCILIEDGRKTADILRILTKYTNNIGEKTIMKYEIIIFDADETLFDFKKSVLKFSKTTNSQQI